MGSRKKFVCVIPAEILKFDLKLVERHRIGKVNDGKLPERKPDFSKLEIVELKRLEEPSDLLIALEHDSRDRKDEASKLMARGLVKPIASLKMAEDVHKSVQVVYFEKLKEIAKRNNMVIVMCNESSGLAIGRYEVSKEARDAFLELDLEEEPEVFVFNQWRKQRRDVRFFSDEVDSYKYSGREAKATKLPSELNALLEDVNERFEEEFNGLLINRYKDGTKTIGAHSDDEKDLGKSGVISYSMGATRKFRIRAKNPRYFAEMGIEGNFVDYDVEDGMLLWMMGDFQSMFTHEVPVQKKVTESRTSITFRRHVS